MSNYYSTSSSPPPLQHPVPTHPAYIPEPPLTPNSPQGYQRFTSSDDARAQQHGVGTLHVPQAPQPYSHPMQPYTSPFQHSQQPQMQQQHRLMQPGQPAPMDFAAWGINDVTTQFGMQLGQNAVAAGSDYVKNNFGVITSPFTALKPHFNVSNFYVIKKIQVVLFPWTHKPWPRKVKRSEQGQAEWQPPREDINSPDLYIPVMALTTYILLVALQYGLKDDFHPKLLGNTMSRAIFVSLLDFIFFKAGCYVLNVQGSSQFADIIAYGGYKFVGVVFTLIAGILGLSGALYTITFLYAFLANAFFLLRSPVQ